MRRFTTLFLAFALLAVILPLTVLQANAQFQSPSYTEVNPTQLYRFRIPGGNLGYILTTEWTEGTRNNFIYQKIMGGVYVPPSGYTPDPASGLVPLYRWNVLQNGRGYTY